MKIKEGFVLRTVCGVNVVSGEGLQQVDYSKLISLNDTAAYLWQSVQETNFDADALTELLLGRYEVDEDTARSDARKIIAEWTELGLVE